MVAKIVSNSGIINIFNITNWLKSFESILSIVEINSSKQALNMNLSNVDLNLLKVFEALFIERNVSNAAKRLGIAQSSLSSSLKRLRVLFSDELFVRTAGGMQPSKRATAIEPQISSCLDAVREAMIGPTEFDPTQSTRVFSIGGSDFTAFTILPGLIDFLKKEAPHIRMKMVPILPNEAVDAIDQGRVDFAVCSGNAYPKRIHQHTLFEEDMTVISSKNNPLLEGAKKLDLKKYAELQHIYIESKGHGEVIVDRLLKKKRLSRDIYLRVQNFLIVPFLVETSDLVATVSERVAYQCSQRSKINIYPFPAEIEKNQFNLLWGKAANLDPESLWLIQAIAELMDNTEKPQA